MRDSRRSGLGNTDREEMDENKGQQRIRERVCGRFNGLQRERERERSQRWRWKSERHSRLDNRIDNCSHGVIVAWWSALDGVRAMKSTKNACTPLLAVSSRPSGQRPLLYTHDAGIIFTCLSVPHRWKKHMLCPAPRLCQFSNSSYPFHSPSPLVPATRLRFRRRRKRKKRKRERETRDGFSREGFFCEREERRDCRFASSYRVLFLSDSTRSILN